MMISNSTILIPFSGTIIDTSAIDAWRQGVEITQFKHWDAGTVKIRSGEKGHRLAVLTFVADKLDDLQHSNFFLDDINLLASENTINNLSTRTHESIKNVNGPGSFFIGSLEPISKQKKLTTALDRDGFPLIDVHIVRAEANIIQSINDIEVNRTNAPYADLKDPRSILLTHNVSQSVVPYSEFVVLDSFNDSEINRALSLMSPSTDNYISDKEFSGCCGYTYDENHKGTDSIAFGGMGY